MRGLNVVSPDGNGRTGRLILNLFLMQNGYPPINVKFADRKRYYEAFDSYYRDNDAGAMVQLIAEYVEERLIRYIEITNWGGIENMSTIGKATLQSDENGLVTL